MYTIIITKNFHPILPKFIAIPVTYKFDSPDSKEILHHLVLAKQMEACYE